MTVGAKNDTDNMKHLKYNMVFCIMSGCLMLSCNNIKQVELRNRNTEVFLSEMALGYWDLYYTFPTSYLQSRDTDAWFFSQFKTTDSILLCYASEITYKDQDTALLITYGNDTLAQVSLPCSCDWTDEIPYGPRAYDSLNSSILDNIIKVSWHGVQMRLTYDIVMILYPTIEKEMNEMGYVLVRDKERKYPQYLLVKYYQKTDSIQLIKVCEKYSCYFYDDYTNVLRTVFSDYCKNNHVSVLLTAVEIYIPNPYDSETMTDP